MSNLLKNPILIKQCIDNPQEFCRGSNDRFFIGFAFGSFLKVVFSKIGTTSFNTSSHNPNDPSGMGISSLRDSKASFEFTGLLNYRAKTTKTNKFSVVTKSFDIHKLSHKIYSAFFTYARHSLTRKLIARKELVILGTVLGAQYRSLKNDTDSKGRQYQPGKTLEVWH